MHILTLLLTNYYARVERGEVTPRVDIVEQIAKALKISLRFPL